jgi:tetratricopeptide (TPR) repeat protein
MSVQEFDIARIALFRAIRLNRRNPAAWYHLGLLYRDGFDRYYEASREAFNFYVRLEQTADIHMQKVQRSYIPDLNETINRKAASRPGVADRNSEKAAALIAEAEGLQKKGQLTKARKKYEDALAADPLSHKAALGLAVIIPKVEKTPAGAKKQLDAYRTACALQPTSTSTLMTTANLAFRLGFHAVAQDYYSRALATDPTDLAALDGIVKSCRKVGKGNIADAYQAYRDELAAKRK